MIEESDADIYDRLVGPLLRFATTLVGPDDAADVVSAVVVRSIAKRPLSDLREPRAYLMRAVLNEARNPYRSRKRGLAALLRLPNSSAVEDGERMLYPEVTELVLSLPLRQRAVVYLVYWVGCSPSEAAEILGLRPATARRYLKLARDRLHGLLEKGSYLDA